MPPLEPTLQTRLEAFIDFKVKHPRLEEMDRDLMRLIQGHRRYTMLALYRTTGVGKSTVISRVAKSLREEEHNPSLVPVVPIRASQEYIGYYARLYSFSQALAQL